MKGAQNVRANWCTLLGPRVLDQKEAHHDSAVNLNLPASLGTVRPFYHHQSAAWQPPSLHKEHHLNTGCQDFPGGQGEEYLPYNAKWVEPWLGTKIPTCLPATKPVCLNLRKQINKRTKK